MATLSHCPYIVMKADNDQFLDIRLLEEKYIIATKLKRYTEMFEHRRPMFVPHDIENRVFILQVAEGQIRIGDHTLIPRGKVNMVQPVLTDFHSIDPSYDFKDIQGKDRELSIAFGRIDKAGKIFIEKVGKAEADEKALKESSFNTALMWKLAGIVGICLLLFVLLIILLVCLAKCQCH